MQDCKSNLAWCLLVCGFNPSLAKNWNQMGSSSKSWVELDSFGQIFHLWLFLWSNILEFYKGLLWWSNTENKWPYQYIQVHKRGSCLGPMLQIINNRSKTICQKSYSHVAPLTFIPFPPPVMSLFSAPLNFQTWSTLSETSNFCLECT